MKTPVLSGLLWTLTSIAPCQPTFEELQLPDGEVLRYAVGLPDDYDAEETFPVLLALPPGAQDEAMVRAGFARYWGEPARRAGWVVISPVAPRSGQFWDGGEVALGPLLQRVRETFRIARGRLHLAGASNGGRGAFRTALRHRGHFLSLTVLPGYPPAASDAARLAELRGVPVSMFVGGDDGEWVERSRDAAASLVAAGVDVSLTIFDGEGHVPPSLDGGALMRHLVEVHAGGQPPSAWEGAGAALDDFHDAAAKGDEQRYFERFAPEGVFLGTDATERWTLAEFRAFALPYFERPSAWIYVPQQRHVQLAPGGEVAWFDESLWHDRLGECRGSGALRRIDGEWRVAQYNLTVPVPNDLMAGVAARIRAFHSGRALSPTIVLLVRHTPKAEVEGDPDPPLSDVGQRRARQLAQVLADVPVAAAYATEFRRTQATLAPLCGVKDLSPVIVPARQPQELAAALRSGHAGEVVVVAGHSNTLPEILAALGATDPPELTEEDYDDLFCVVLDADGAHWLRLHW